MLFKWLKDREYLGDGVYIGHDGYQIWIVTYDGVTTTNEIALDDSVLANLQIYVEKARKKSSTHTEEG